MLYCACAGCHHSLQFLLSVLAASEDAEDEEGDGDPLKNKKSDGGEIRGTEEDGRNAGEVAGNIEAGNHQILPLKQRLEVRDWAIVEGNGDQQGRGTQTEVHIEGGRREENERQCGECGEAKEAAYSEEDGHPQIIWLIQIASLGLNGLLHFALHVLHFFANVSRKLLGLVLSFVDEAGVFGTTFNVNLNSLIGSGCRIKHVEAALLRLRRLLRRLERGNRKITCIDHFFSCVEKDVI